MNINDLSYNIIFNEIEREANLKYGSSETIYINKNLNSVNIPKTILNKNITFYSNHSFSKSISLYYCFEQINEYAEKGGILNFEFDLKYIRYIKENIKLIDFLAIDEDELSKNFRSVFVAFQKNKILSSKNNNSSEFSDFIFSLADVCLAIKNRKIIAIFIESMLKIFSIKVKDYEFDNDETRVFMFNLNLILFKNLFEYVVLSSGLSKGKIFEIIFNSEFIFSTRKNIAELKLKAYNLINDFKYKSFIKISNELNAYHKEYLKYCKNEYLKINDKNKDKYLKLYKDETDIIQYVFILEYLNDIKKYLRYKLSK